MSMSGPRLHHPLCNDLLPLHGFGRCLSGAAHPAKLVAPPLPLPSKQTTNNMNLTLTLILGCLALAANAPAHGGANGKDGRQSATPADLLSKFDKNGDGMLDASELAALTSEKRASLGQHGQHHGHPGRGKGGPGPAGKGDGPAVESHPPGG